MNINWTKVYSSTRHLGRTMKFDVLPNSIPWGESVEENLWMTLEWLVRESRGEHIRFSKEPMLRPVRDDWYQAEFENDDGRFVHICYPSDILKFRGQYEGVKRSLEESSCMQQEQQQLRKQAQQLLWSAWGCIGNDGERTKPPPPSSDEIYIPIWHEWAREWKNQCSRCCAPLPKSLQMWIKLQHSKLKDVR